MAARSGAALVRAPDATDEAKMENNLLHFEALPEDKLRRIEETGLRLLEEVGISLTHERAREMLHGLGCRVVGERVFIPRTVVEWAHANITKEAVIRNRDGTRELVLGGRRLAAHNGGSVPNILDHGASAPRPAALQDLIVATRVLDALANVDMVIPLVSPSDVPGALIMIASFEALLRNTSKPIGAPPAENPDDVRFLVALAAACCGGMDAFRKKPTMPIMVSPISPLGFSDKVTGAILAVAEAGAPFYSLPAPSMGATGPVTLAGVLAQQHAEVLASMVIAAAARPGIPFAYCSRIIPLDMRTAVAAWGGPEIGLSGAIAAQLAHRLGLACDTYGLATSAQQVDAQFAYERFANALLPALAGADLLSGVGSIENGMTVSLEAAVLDDELLAMIRHILRGCEVNDETLAFEVVRDAVQGGGMFLASDHTVEQLSKGALWMPSLAFRATFDESEAPMTMLARGHERVEELAASHTVEPVSDEADRQLRAVMEQARRELVVE